MIENIRIANFGPIDNLEWKNLSNINLIIGRNSSGKTFLLKSIYSAIRCIESNKRGQERRSLAEILVDKLYWTFQADKIGDLVSKGSEDHLAYQMTVDNKDFNYSFGKDTVKQIAQIENQVEPRSSNSIFLPAKEVLSLHQIILKTREQDKLFGFDDTYYDLAQALRNLPTRGKNYRDFAEVRKKIENLVDGRVDYDEESGLWQYKRANQKFSIGVTAEGIKKVAILDTLLGNRYLDTNSIIFIDEPESALHPTAISEFLEIIAILAASGLQFFLASHSYFVIKKLFLIAQRDQLEIPIISNENDTWLSDDLLKGMPNNSIIDESIRLYKDEVELVLQ